MKTNHFFLYIILLLLPYISFSQNRLNDLTILNDIIKKTPSFKSQIKGQRIKEFDKLYEKLKSKVDEKKTDLQHFEILSELVGQINDNHFVLQYIPDTSFDWKRYSDKLYVSEFLKKDYLFNHPKVIINIDSLELSLKNKQINEVEGIYYFQSLSHKIGVFKVNDSVYNGVILESLYPIWEKGDLCFILKEKSPNYFHSINYLISQKTLQFNKNEKYKEGELLGYNISKTINKKSYPFIPDSLKKYYSYKINSNIRYVRLGDFMVNPSNKKISSTFFNELKSSMNEKVILLDLRNNNGGGDVISRPFLKLFKRYSKKNEIKVLINRKTISNTEQFVIRLKKYNNVTLFGEDTEGMVTYGSNYGRQIPLKSKGLFVYPTDMRGLKKDLQYETIGIRPNVYLSKDSDWIEQVLKKEF
ncbi:MAG: S41 family peptidase [Bacteroidetes bacterium]|nr:S41 family peptidase [Bacteroidota bacterium]